MSGHTDLLMMSMPPGTSVMSLNSSANQHQAVHTTPENVHLAFQIGESAQQFLGKKKQFKLERQPVLMETGPSEHFSQPSSVMQSKNATKVNSRGSSVSRPGTSVVRQTTTLHAQANRDTIAIKGSVHSGTGPISVSSVAQNQVRRSS